MLHKVGVVYWSTSNKVVEVSRWAEVGLDALAVAPTRSNSFSDVAPGRFDSPPLNSYRSLPMQYCLRRFSLCYIRRLNLGQ